MPTATHVNQQPNQVTHHMVQKGIARDVKLNKWPVSHNLQRLQPSNRRCSLALRRSKCGEVVFSHQAPCCHAHCDDVQVMMGPARSPRQQGVPNWRGMEQVPITPRERAKARVKLSVDTKRPPDRNALRQVGIDAAHPCCVRAVSLGIEMNHLPERMNTRIGPTCAGCRNLMASDLSERSLEVILNRRARWLSLPPVKARAVIAKYERNTHHCCLSVSGPVAYPSRDSRSRAASRCEGSPCWTTFSSKRLAWVRSFARTSVAARSNDSARLARDIALLSG